jgi:hypothetical protein
VRLVLAAIAAFMMLVPTAMAQKIVAPTQSAPSPAPSQPPNPSDQPNQRDLQQPNTKEHGTEDVPFIVKVIPSEPSSQQQKREDEKARQDRRLADYTEFLFFATVFLGIVTGGLAFVAFFQMRDARKAIAAAEASAKASEQHAKTAERALTELERAYIAAGIGGTGVVRDSADQQVVILRASALNYGKTPGFIDYIHYHVGPYGPIHPTELPITGDGYQRNMFVGWIIGPETRRNEELQTNPPFARYPLPLIEPLIFHGLLTYSDIFGKRHYCGFAHRINEDGSTQPISRVDAYVRRD